MGATDLYPEIVAGLVARFQTVPGLSRQNNRGVEVGVLDYEPQTIQAAPVLYGILERFERAGAKGQQIEMVYFMLWRLAIKWQDNQTAERELMRFVNPIPSALDRDRYLGSILLSGGAFVESATAGYTRIGDALHRIVDFRVKIVHKLPDSTGI